MKRWPVVLCLFAAAAAGGAEPVAGPSAAMSGKYQCDGGVTFSARVRAAPVIKSDLDVTTPGAGARIEFKDKKYSLRAKPGSTTELTNDTGELRWVLDEIKAPFRSRLFRRNDLLGDKCRLVEPDSRK